MNHDAFASLKKENICGLKGFLGVSFILPLIINYIRKCLGMQPWKENLF